jgi:diguanylate cyclase (GGDEF)-like protein
MFVFVGFGLIIYGYAYYIINKIKNPSLRYFPVIGFLLPVFIGNAVQMQIYGISLLPISFTVAFAAITISLQNECIYIDKLTGVYNRYELDKILRKGFRRKNLKIAALMLDLNDFKAINDNYSHEEGDEALVAFATILADTIRAEGVVIRFAGDEFIVIMPKFQDVDISEYEARIHAGLDAYNESSGKPYELSAAIGGKVFDPRTDNMDSVLKDIDALMYSAKREYYSKHDRRHNRSPQPAAQS